MEAIIHSPFSSPAALSSLLARQPAQRRISHKALPCLTKQVRRLSSRSHHRVQALDGAADIVPRGGDISVLVPVSAVLLFMYWIANFVVPEIVSKDLERKAKEELEEQSDTIESRISEAAVTSEPTPPRKKMKKADPKKVIRP